MPDRRLDAEGRQARRAHRASRPPARRDAVPAARLSGSDLVTATATRAVGRAGLGLAAARCPTPRSRSSRWSSSASCATSLGAGRRARRHRHADLLRLPGHRRHRARDRERAARAGAGRACGSSGASRRPGPPTGSAKPAASGCAPTASPRRRPSTAVLAAGSRARPQAGRDRLPALRLDRHRAGREFGSTPCKAQYRCRRASSRSTTSSASDGDASIRSPSTGVRRETRDPIVADAAPPEAVREAFRFARAST